MMLAFNFVSVLHYLPQIDVCQVSCIQLLLHLFTSESKVVSCYFVHKHGVDRDRANLRIPARTVSVAARYHVSLQTFRLYSV